MWIYSIIGSKRASGYLSDFGQKSLPCLVRTFEGSCSWSWIARSEACPVPCGSTLFKKYWFRCSKIHAAGRTSYPAEPAEEQMILRVIITCSVGCLVSCFPGLPPTHSTREPAAGLSASLVIERLINHRRWNSSIILDTAFICLRNAPDAHGLSMGNLELEHR